MPDIAPTSEPASMTRRKFLKQLGVLGGGIVVYFTWGDALLLAQTRREGFLGARIPTDFNAFLRIGSDERITCLTGKIEMGQGPITSLPQMLAEELDVSIDAVDIIMGDTDLCPWDVGTFGSLSTRHFGPFLMEAAAEAKGVLKELAADFLKVPVDRLKTENGIVFDAKDPGKRVTYGQLTKGKIIEKHLEKIPPLKPVAEYQIMGKSFLRRDAYDKVTGKAKYSGDIRLPGMLYACILRPPAHGAELVTADTSDAEKVPGARVIREGQMIAVLHDLPDVADKAAKMIKAEFKRPNTGIDDQNIFDHFLKKPPSPQTVSQGGSLKQGEKLADVVVEETYLNSYVAHAPMEPHAAVAKFENGKLTVWASTQTPFPLKDLIVETLKLKPENVRIIPPFVGGGFGGKGESQQAVEAAILAKASGRPVQVAWSRAEEFYYDTFRPAAVVKIKAGMSKTGEMVLWDYQVHQAGDGGSELFYNVPNHQETAYGGWMSPGRGTHPFAVGPWRAPGNNTNTYARELHINLLAAKAGMDPLEFRLKNLTDQRMIGVLKAAAQKFGWTPAKPPSGRGYGIACCIDVGTYVATMAEVEVDKASGDIRVKRVVAAQDMGFVVNPEGARIQMEGCITMGLGYSLAEEIRFKDGEIFDQNFDTYQLPLFSWLPKIETVLVENNDLAPQGGGEPAIVNMGGVIATAIHDAVGAKMLQLPMTPDRVLAALKQAG